MAPSRTTSKRTGWLAAIFVSGMLAATLLLQASRAAADAPRDRQDPGATATIAALLVKKQQVEATQTAQAAGIPVATSTPLPLPSATSRPLSSMAEALVAGLNVRSGPGSSYAILANARVGQQFPVTGQSGGCAWLQVLLEDGSFAWISGSPGYTRLNVTCSVLPAAAPPQAAAPTPTRALQATPAPRPAQPLAVPTQPTAALAPGQITGFEPFGSWRRGDEPYGTLQPSSAQVHSGTASAALEYNFPAKAGTNNYVVFLPQQALRLPDGTHNLQMQVYGDGSGHYLNVWIIDSRGQTWQFTFGRINHVGWQPMTARLAPNRDWPNGPISNVSSDELSAPLSIKALILDGIPDGTESSGTIYLDSLVTSSNATAVATANGVSATEATAETVDGVNTSVVAPTDDTLVGKIAYTRFNGSKMNTLVYDIEKGSVVAELPDKRQPDLAGGLLLVNAEGGGEETIVRMTDYGGNARPITAHPEDAFPQWSPSMASLVYVSTSNGDRRARLYWQEDAGAQFEVSPMIYGKRELFGDYPVYLDNWRIAFLGCNTWSGGSKCGIYSTDTKGGEPLQATTLTGDIPTGNLGSQILFTSNRSGNYDVWVVNFDGGGLRQLTDSPAIEGLATASPDYKHIAFVTNRDGKWSVYVMNSDGTNERKLFDLNGGYGNGDYEWYRERISWGP